MVLVVALEELKFIIKESGAQCVVVIGMSLIPQSCVKLGCGDAVDTMQYAYFGEGTGRVLLAEVACGGWETSLKACPHKGLGKHTCQPRNSVGILCSGKVNTSLQ